jgi:hypothetical protein
LLESKPVNDETIATFAQGLRGTLIGRGHPEYEETHKLYNAVIDKRPLLIARCADAADVIAAVNLGRDNRLPIAKLLLKCSPAAAEAAFQSHRHRERAGTRSWGLALRLRSPSSIDPPIAPPKPAPSLRQRSKTSRRRRKYPRSPRRRRCCHNWHKAASGGEGHFALAKPAKIWCLFNRY